MGLALNACKFASTIRVWTCHASASTQVFVWLFLFLSSSLTRDAVRAREVDTRKAQELDNSRRQKNKLPWS